MSKKKSAKKTKCTIEYLKRYFGNKPLARITTADVQEFYNKRMAETTPSTANRHFTVFNAIINKMLRLKLYRGENPCIGVAKHKENPARTNYLTKEQIQNVLTYISGRSQEMVAFAIGTGMRQGEILRLDWRDIDFANNIIHKCQRYDVIGKSILKTQEKYYLGDVSLKYGLMGYNNTMLPAIIENIVYLELRRRGYEVFIGKNQTQEIDFIAQKQDDKVYVQVCVNLPPESTRETDNLLAIKDNYPKYVVTLDNLAVGNVNGVQIVHLSDFLLGTETNKNRQSKSEHF